MSASSHKNRHRRRRQDRPRPAPARAGRRMPTTSSSPPPAATPRVDGVPGFQTIEEMLAAVAGARCRVAVHAAAIPLPRRPRWRSKPASMCSWKSRPAPRVSEVEDLEGAGRRERRRRCSPAGIRATRRPSRPARHFLASTGSRSVPSTGKRTSAAGTPNQEWIWQAGGLRRVRSRHQRAVDRHAHPAEAVRSSPRRRCEFPENRDAPIAAEIAFSDAGRAARCTADFDWRQTGPQSWDIVAETDAGADGAVGRRRQARRRRPHRA